MRIILPWIVGLRADLDFFPLTAKKKENRTGFWQPKDKTQLQMWPNIIAPRDRFRFETKSVYFGTLIRVVIKERLPRQMTSDSTRF